MFVFQEDDRSLEILIEKGEMQGRLRRLIDTIY